MALSVAPTARPTYNPSHAGMIKRRGGVTAMDLPSTPVAFSASRSASSAHWSLRGFSLSPQFPISAGSLIVR